MDTRAADTWRHTVALLEAAEPEVEAGADPATVALAHVGAAVLLFAECDPAMAERLAAVIERQAL